MHARPAVVAVVLLASFTVIAVAHGDPVNLDRPAPVPVLGATLQDEFDAWRTGGSRIDVLAGQQRFAEFTNTASSAAVVVLGRESSSSGGGHRFGLYDALDASKRAVLFDTTSISGGDASGSQKLVTFFGNGDIAVNGVVEGGGFQTPLDFGFFLEVFSSSGSLLRTYFSEDDRNPSSVAQSLVFQGENVTELAIGPFSPGLFSAGEFIVAFDDGPSQDEKDFADFVILFESAIPIPEPAVGLLLTLGAGVLGSIRRRRS